MITLEDRNREKTQGPTITDLQKALTDLYLSKDVEDPLSNYVSLINSDELELQIFQQSIVLQDWGKWGYDGPGGPGEILRVRYKEGSLFNKIQEAVNLLDGEEREALVKLLKSLPEPE